MLGAKKFNLLGRGWKTIIVPDLRDESGALIQGLCEGYKKTIYLLANPSFTEEQYSDTFIHEINHAILFELCFYTMGKWDMDLEEILVDNLSRVYRESFRMEFVDVPKADVFTKKHFDKVCATKKPYPTREPQKTVTSKKTKRKKRPTK